MNSRRDTRPRLVLSALLLFAAVDGRALESSASAPLDVPGRADATPSVAASGRFVAVAWGAASGSQSDVFLAASRDGGATFAAPVQVNVIAGEGRLGGEMPPRVALVRRDGASSPDIVVLYTARGERTAIKMTRSRDGGRTFDAPVALQAPDAPGDRGWPALDVDGRGRLHAIWLDHRGMAANRTAAAARTAQQGGGDHDGAAMAQRSGLYYAAVAAAPSPEREITSGVCYCCKTAIATGRDGAVYAAWRHVYAGNLRDIAFTMSRDGGRSFAAPIRVSQDGWAINGCPDDGPAMVVDATGTAHVVWPTVIGGSAPEGAIFYASTREGRQFTPRVRIPTLGGPKPSHPQIIAMGDGRFAVAWDENVDGRRIAALRQLTVRADAAPVFGPILLLSTDGSGTYPALAVSDRGVVAVWTATGDPSRIETKVLTLP
jgi:hypothetical protein